jgi:hypothetical protein
MIEPVYARDIVIYYTAGVAGLMDPPLIASYVFLGKLEEFCSSCCFNLG